MKFLNNIDNSEMINETTNKKFVTDSEKTAITHTNRAVLDSLSDIAGELGYNGTAIGGGSGAENLTDTALTLGNYRISFNDVTDELDFEYVTST